jgi:hypothetical protein
VGAGRDALITARSTWNFSDGAGVPIGNTWQRVGAPPSRNERNTHPNFTYEQKKKFFMILHNSFWDDPFLIVEMS